jgi:hypothetical protein
MKLKKQKNLLEELVAELEETNAQLNQQINDRKLAEKNSAGVLISRALLVPFSGFP